MSKKLFLIHRIYRHILFLFKWFKNFKFYLENINWELSDRFIRKNYFRFGSTVGLGLYDRTIQLYKHHKGETIKLIFNRFNCR